MVVEYRPLPPPNLTQDQKHPLNCFLCYQAVMFYYQYPTPIPIAAVSLLFYHNYYTEYGYDSQVSEGKNIGGGSPFHAYVY